MHSIAENYRRIIQRVATACEHAGRDPEAIMVVGAAKQVDALRLEEAVNTGLRHVGENYVQEALAKYEILGGRVSWHFIGHLQTNKVKQAVRVFEWIHSLDRIELAREISRRAQEVNRTLRCLVEVNVGREESKSGVDPAAVPDLLRAAAEMPNLTVVGLMAIPPLRENAEESRADFRYVRELAYSVQQLNIPGVAMDYLSMGMTQDFEVAIEEGANVIRVGTGIFGPRR